MPNNAISSRVAPPQALQPDCLPESGVPRRRGRPARNAEAMPREEILRRAFTAFACAGYEGVSLRALARACGISDSLLTHHFGSKQQLWYEATDSVYSPLSDRLMALLDGLARAGDPVTILRSNLTQAMKLMVADPVALQFLFREGEGDDERGEYIRARYVRPYLARLDALFAQAQRDGRYIGIAPVSRHVLVFGLMRSLVMPGLMRAELEPHLTNRESLERYLDEAALVLYHGLLATPQDIASASPPANGDHP